MIKTKIIKVKSIENGKIIMEMTMTKIVITTIITKIIIIILTKFPTCFQKHGFLVYGSS